MSDAYRRLNESLPQRSAADAGAFTSEPRALRTWLDALPMANFSVTAQRLLSALNELNQQRLDGGRRLEALETLRPAVMQLAIATDKQIVGASFPLPPQQVELGAVALGFQNGLALGYRIALAELCAPKGSVPFLRSKQVVLAAVRALQHGDEHLAKAYLLYLTAPSGAWQNLHNVYGFIAWLRLDDRIIEDVQTKGLHAREAYAHALLFALANPYRCTQREQGELIAFTRNLAPHCELRHGTASASDVLIHVYADRGPGYLPEERVAGQRNALALRLDAMFEFIDQQLATVPAGARTAVFPQRGGMSLHVDIGLVHRLIAAWNSLGARAHTRLGGGYMLDTVFGMRGVHYALTGGTDFESFMRQVSGYAISLSESDRRATWRSGHGDAAHTTNFTARVLDQSLGGYRIVWERAAAGDQAHVRVGELVGLALPEPNADAKPHWMAGVVRWIRIDEGGRVDAGVELLARRVLPVSARALDHHHERAPVRGLLFAPMVEDATSGYTALLVSSEVDHATQSVELSVPADMLGPPMPAYTGQFDDLYALEAVGIYHHFALPSRADALVAVETPPGI